MHPFEKAGLGKAPFHCTGVQENRFEMPGFGWKPGGSCNYCGTGILYEYQIVSSDGARFHVGSDCVNKLGFSDLIRTERLGLARAKRQAGAAKRKAERDAQWALEREARRATNLDHWIANHSDLDAILKSYAGTNSFILSMAEAVRTFGSLTDRQLAAVQGSLAFEAKREAIRANSKHVGTVGERCKNIPCRVTFSKNLGQTDFYPFRTRYLVKLETETGDQLTWFTTGSGCQIETEFTPTSFTVKAHDEYNGIKQTTVTRVK